MSDRPTLTSFEARIAADLERYVAGAYDPRPTEEIADAAMRPRGIRARVTGSARSRRLTFLALAAALLVPAAYIAATINKVPESDYRAVVIRPSTGSVAGISIFAVRPDGAERLLREVPNSILPGGNTLAAWGTAAESGWIALAESRSLSQMVLVDLSDPASEPWIVPGTNIGAVGPAFGPTGLVAAPGGGGLWPVVIVDPETRTAHALSGAGQLIGSGPTIIWNADGSGVVVTTAEGLFYKTSTLDGAHDTDGFPRVFQSRGGYGDGGATLRVCAPGRGCSGGDDGRVELVQIDSTATTVYRQQGSERVLKASFGSSPNEYVILLDSDAGRQVVAMQLDGGTATRLATINRGANWLDISAPVPAPDGSLVALYVDVNGKRSTVIAPVDGGTPSFHEAWFAGFMTAAIADAVPGASYSSTGSERVVAPGAGYKLTSLDDLIAAELSLNPGERVLASGSRDGVPGDSAAATYLVAAREAGTGSVYIDCFGPAPMTVSAHGRSATNPCLNDGTQGFGINILELGDVIQVETTGEVSWRIAMYSCENCYFP